MALSSRLTLEDDRSAILLIGIDETQPLTIIEGNHRVTAATLASPAIALRRFRYICGFSPRMTECCWYQTNLTTLWRYARNRMKILLYDREAEIARLARHYQPAPSESANEAGVAESRLEDSISMAPLDVAGGSENAANGTSDMLGREAS